MTDPLEALKALREDPFADWHDVATILPAALSHLCAMADNLADELDMGWPLPSDIEPNARSLAVSLGDVLIAATTLGSRVPSRPALAPEHHEDPWAWAWPEELRVGMSIRFPLGGNCVGMGPWRVITAAPTQMYAAWGRAFYLDEDEHLTRISKQNAVQVLLTDPDAVAEFYAEKRDRMVQP